MVYSTLDALKIARDNPDRQVVFFAIGFETTTPPTAVAIKQAEAEGLRNFSVFCNHVLTPAAIGHILQFAGVRARRAGADRRLSGAVPCQRGDRLEALRVRRPRIPEAGCDRRFRAARRHAVGADADPAGQRGPRRGRERIYPRRHARGQSQGAGAGRRGARTAPSFEWRGLGEVPTARCASATPMPFFDAEKRFAVSEKAVARVKSCECPAILRGVKKPTDCKLFGTVCTPDNPMGPAWSRRKAPARPTGPMAGSATPEAAEGGTRMNMADGRSVATGSRRHDPWRRRPRHGGADRDLFHRHLAIRSWPRATTRRCFDVPPAGW
jgi:hydrogenase expression/formation protein HypD